jgi:hypothetical protein
VAEAVEVELQKLQRVKQHQLVDLLVNQDPLVKAVDLLVNQDPLVKAVDLRRSLVDLLAREAGLRRSLVDLLVKAVDPRRSLVDLLVKAVDLPKHLERKEIFLPHQSYPLGERKVAVDLPKHHLKGKAW